MYYDCDYHMLSQINLTYMIWKQIVVNLNINTILFKSIISYTHGFKITNDMSCLWQVPFVFTYSYCFFSVTYNDCILFSYVFPHTS